MCNQGREFSFAIFLPLSSPGFFLPRTITHHLVHLHRSHHRLVCGEAPHLCEVRPPHQLPVLPLLSSFTHPHHHRHSPICCSHSAPLIILLILSGLPPSAAYIQPVIIAWRVWSPSVVLTLTSFFLPSPLSPTPSWCNRHHPSFSLVPFVHTLISLGCCRCGRTRRPFPPIHTD